MDDASPPPGHGFDTGGPTLQEVGEAELLRRLTAVARRRGDGDRLVVASGDDAAVWRPPGGAGIVISQDAIVEGEDFLRSWIDPEAVGRRALAIALSDLAAMGARPALCLVTLCAPGTSRIDDLLAIQEGIGAAASEAGCRVAGGDVSAIAGPLVIDVVVVGTVDPGRALRRDRGRPGDLLVVTGCLGGAAAGLRLLLDGRRELVPPAGGHRHAAEGNGQGPPGHGHPSHGHAHPPAEDDAAADAEARWLGRQLRPRARLAEGQALVRLGVNCAGDLSDGLIVDVGRITDASGCAAEIWLESVPTEPGIRTLLGAAWVDAALGGGEDFELVAAVAAERLDGLLARWPGGLAPLHVVGRLTPGSGLRLLDRREGQEVPLPPVASRHFRQP
ncbi:MAG: AIR synthase related protein [Candidatus Dormibacteria bacterium]|jgi:thiamine-monophosphate kinase